jgi:hypothetical protein
VLAALRATARRLGARSGKTMVILSNTASGKARRAILSVATRTTVGTARTATHHPTNQAVVCGLGRTCAVIVAEAIESAIGMRNTTTRTSTDRRGRPCHWSSRGLSSSDVLRIVTTGPSSILTASLCALSNSSTCYRSDRTKG